MSLSALGNHWLFLFSLSALGCSYTGGSGSECYCTFSVPLCQIARTSSQCYSAKCAVVMYCNSSIVTDDRY